MEPNNSDIVRAIDALADATRGNVGLAVRTRNMIQISGPASTTFNQMADAVTSNVVHACALPDDYVSGDITVKYYLRPAAAGTAALRSFLYRGRAGAAFTVLESSVNVNTTFATTNTLTLTRTIAAANFAPGDTIRADLQRLGADAADVLAGVVETETVVLEYLGRK